MCSDGAESTPCMHACVCVGVLMPACPFVLPVPASSQVRTELGGIDLKLELTLHLLGLKAAANTIVGSKTVRGVSGGERHRVTTAEMISGEWATPRPSHTFKQ